MPAVLVVDDDHDTRELLTTLLDRGGYQVASATDARQAAALLAGVSFDAVLLDVRMPGASGIDLCRGLRGRRETAALPIMLVSADVFDTDMQAGYAAGADDYLAKPFRRVDLLTRLDAMIGRRTTAPASAARAAMLATSAAAPGTWSAGPVDAPAGATTDVA